MYIYIYFCTLITSPHTYYSFLSFFLFIIPPNSYFTASDVPETNTHYEWRNDTPKTILIVKKHRDPHTTKWLNTIASWVTETFKARVLVEPEAASESQYVQTYPNITFFPLLLFGTCELNRLVGKF